jgi:stearoyl-CoA desaturase (Delta-9 desaturase)
MMRSESAPLTAERIRVVSAVIDQLILLPIISMVTVVFGDWNLLHVSLFIFSHFVHYAGMSICLHRYFSHRAFKTSRAFQFVLGFWGYLSNQGGPLFWAGTHRHHHRHCDQEQDHHSPLPRSFMNFLKSHCLWMYTEEVWKKEIYRARVRDLTKFPELKLFDQTELVAYMVCIPLLWHLGGWQLVGFVFFLPKFTSFHCTALVNSANHLWGYAVSDPRPKGCEARNLLWTFPFQLGDNWHSNHHRWPSSASNQLRWWELDPMFGIVCVLEKLGLIWDVQRSPRERMMGS